mgnify:CR=1 FL=1
MLFRSSHTEVAAVAAEPWEEYDSSLRREVRLMALDTVSVLSWLMYIAQGIERGWWILNMAGWF